MEDQEKERENEQKELDEKKRLLEEFEKEEPEEIISSQEDPTPEEEVQTGDPENKDDDLLVVIEGEQGAQETTGQTEPEPEPSEPDHDLTSKEQELPEGTEVTAGEKAALISESEGALTESAHEEIGRPRQKILNVSLLRKASSALVLIIGLYWCFLGSQNHDLQMLIFAFLLIASGLFYLNFKIANE